MSIDHRISTRPSSRVFAGSSRPIRRNLALGLLLVACDPSREPALGELRPEAEAEGDDEAEGGALEPVDALADEPHVALGPVDVEMFQGNKLVFDENAGKDTFMQQDAADVLTTYVQGARVQQLELLGGGMAGARAVLVKPEATGSAVYTMPLDFTGAAIQTAIDGLPAAAGKVVLPSGTYVLDDGLVVDRNHLAIEGDSVVLRANYTSSTPALSVEPPLGQTANVFFSLRGDVRIEKQTLTPTAPTTVGLRLLNSVQASIDGLTVRNFGKGLLMLGQRSASSYNYVRLVELKDNVVNLAIEAEGEGGYNNQNTFVAGRLWYADTSTMAAAGAVQVRLADDNGTGQVNGNTFISLGLEAAPGAGPFPLAVECLACAGNTFQAIRTEQSLIWIFDEESAFNHVIGGRNVRPGNVIDNGVGNMLDRLEDAPDGRVTPTNVLIGTAADDFAVGARGFLGLEALQQDFDAGAYPTNGGALYVKMNMLGQAELWYRGAGGIDTKLAP